MTDKKMFFRLAVSFLLFSLGCIPQTSYAQTLVWEENFNASSINPTTWTYDLGDGCQIGNCGWGNSELEYYTNRTDNARIENGNLVIEAHREAFQGKPFTSARLKTEGRMHFKYGTVEARIKIPKVENGLWPAFWTLGTVGASWPSIGEIDMMEVGSSDALKAGLGSKRVSSAAHWSNAAGAHDYNVFYTNSPVDLSLDYHLYKMVWTKDYIKMFLDNVEYYSFNINGADSAILTEFHNPHFLMLDLAVGGNYTGLFKDTDINATLPGKMYVDYIRLYQNPGDVLYLADNNAFFGNYGIFTEKTPVNAALSYGTDADLFYWNNLTAIPNAVPFEGSNVWAVHASPGNWFGMGVQNNYKNLNDFANGSLTFRFKSTYAGQCKIGIKTGFGESWINFPAGSTPYGLKRDGSWSKVTIPLRDFQNPALGMTIDLYSVKNAFMFAGDAPSTAADFYFDDIYYTGGVSANPVPTVAITSPINQAIFPTPGGLTIRADAAEANGAIRKVDFYNGTILLGTDTTSPYTFLWPSPSPRVDTLTAVATDTSGNMTTSAPVIVFVSNPNNMAPTATIVSPANNASYLTPATIVINANATDADGSIYQVAFYNGTTLLATSNTAPYSYTWTGATAGNYALSVLATDNGGLVTTSSIINITVSDPIKPPVVACTGTAANGDYSYEVYSDSTAGTVNFKLHPLAPIAGSTSAIIYLKQGTGSAIYPGYPMIASGSDFIFSKPIAAGTITSFYFSYNVPSGGERNSSANPQAYVVGTVCVAGAPTVSIISPVDGTSFTAPATIAIQATASDPDGTVPKVQFYNGTTLIGTGDSVSHIFNWKNVAAGNYTITAKATSDSGLTTASIPVNIIVNAPNTDGYCGTALSGDYEYKAQTVNGLVTFTFHPLSPIAGSAYALIYIQSGGSSTYPGFSMSASGTDFVFTKAIADTTAISFYFTYNVPAGGERNSSANPHRYVPGSNCTGLIALPPTINITSPINNTSFTEPAAIAIKANAADPSGTVSKVEFYSGSTFLGVDSIAPYSFNWTNVPAGNYTISAKATDNSSLSTISTFVNLVVNINHSAGFCATAANGDYDYTAETINGNVLFTFHPLAPITGSAYALVYIREGSTGAYPGYAMTAIGPDFRYTQAIADSTRLSIYFTYNVPSGGERNSSANPHPYTVGTNCLNLALATNDLVFSKHLFALYPTLADAFVNVHMNENVKGQTQVSISNMLGQNVYFKMLTLTGNTEPNAIPTANLPSGMYVVAVYAGSTYQSQKFVVAH